MFIGILCLLLSFFITVGTECPFYSKTYLNNGHLANYSFFNDSKECTNNLPQGTLPKCSQNFADVHFDSIGYLPNGTNT